MPLVTFVQEGSAVDYTPSADVAAGDVIVLNDLVGVTKRKIPANTQGALHVAGVFDFPKATGATTAIAAGKTVYWNATPTNSPHSTTPGISCNCLSSSRGLGIEGICISTI